MYEQAIYFCGDVLFAYHYCFLRVIYAKVSQACNIFFLVSFKSLLLCLLVTLTGNVSGRQAGEIYLKKLFHFPVRLNGGVWTHSISTVQKFTFQRKMFPWLTEMNRGRRVFNVVIHSLPRSHVNNSALFRNIVEMPKLIRQVFNGANIDL